MTRLRLSIICAVAILAIGLTTYFAKARDGHPDHASGSQALSGLLSNATVSFGEWMTPVDRFPNNSPREANHHELIPKVATIRAGGTVNFIVAGFHINSLPRIPHLTRPLWLPQITGCGLRGKGPATIS
jgi:hypothetical protein